MPSPSTKRKQSLMRQAAKAVKARHASMTRFNSLVRQIALAARHNALPAHLKPIKISVKRK